MTAIFLEMVHMFHGSMVALVTPMFEDGAIDWQAFADLVEFHIDNGTDAIVAVGTTGESATLNFAEHCEVIRRVVEIAKERLPIIAGTGANATAEAISLTRYAMEAGADAALLVTPYYNKPTQEGLYQHYKAIADAVPIPQIMYNVPSRTACDLLPETVARLVGISNIIGLKEATGDLDRLTQLKELCGEQIDIFIVVMTKPAWISCCRVARASFQSPIMSRLLQCTIFAKPRSLVTPIVLAKSMPRLIVCIMIYFWKQTPSRSNGPCTKWA